MKITYEFDNGDIVTVQASDEIGRWILASREEKRRRFRNAITHLTKKEQELLNAMIYEGKSQADYAREHKLDKGMISRRYKSAIQKIKNGG
ncbi:MAG: hypothetical protein Q4A48_07065 [Bacillota bacterium]|nr:hypothetical protein [Bacillota bacterium]